MKSKIMLFSSTLILSVLLCQVIFNVFLSKSYYTRLKKAEVKALFYEIKQHYSDNPDELYKITQKNEDAYNINVFVYNEREMIYSNRSFGTPLLRRNFFGINISEQNAFVDAPRATILRIPRTNSENIVLAGKFEFNGEYRYIVIMTPVESIEASVRVLTKVNITISVSILIVGIIGSLIFAKRFSKPIQNIQEVARNVAHLNFDIRADENLSTAELCSLSSSINVMSDKLNSLITDLQASNEKLQEDIDYQMRLDKMRRDFVANVSHELKTPLHLLLLYSENLKNNIDGIDKDYYCDTIIDETNKLNDMVKSLLDLSAIENGLTKINTEVFDFSELSYYVVSKTDVLFEGLSPNINIEKDIRIDGDRHYLGQAMKNYIMNAVSHTPPGGKISISLKQRDGKAVFSVFNEGNHITTDDITQIWESFYKTDKARVRTEESHTGLGLYIVKTIIEAHGGEYGVQNVEYGVEFWFSLWVI